MAKPVQRNFEGLEVKRAIRARIRALKAELAQTTRDMDSVLLESKTLQHFSIRGPFVNTGNTVRVPHKHEIHQRLKAEIDSALQTNFLLEQEISRLSMIAHHLDDGQIVTLDDSEVNSWGLETLLEIAR